MTDHNGAMQAAEQLAREVEELPAKYIVGPIARFIEEVRRADAEQLLRWRKAIEGLTPGGSEFVDDPERCARWIEQRYWQPWKRERELREQIRTLREALEEICARLCPPNHKEATVGANFGGKMQMAYRKAQSALAQSAPTE